jgi:hypothetical protein
MTVACGGHVATGVGPADAGSESAQDAPTGMDESAPPGCVSPSGYAICGGTHDCFPPSERGPQTACWYCLADWGYQTVLCENAVAPNPPLQMPGMDGDVYVEGNAPNVWESVPFDVGEMFAENDAVDRVRYADWSSWTWQPLPTPTMCPTFPGFSICGGQCGGCASGYICTGRSPNHPYGMCVSNSATGCGSGWACPPQQSCVVFADPGDQAVADLAGLCVPSSTCQALAADYPGGANCH